MARTFEINKKDGTNVVPAGASPLTITGIAAGTVVAAGDYVGVAIEDTKKSKPVDIPAFTVKPAVIAVSGVTLDKTELSVAVAATGKLTATIAPTTATNKAMTYKSSDDKIATVGTDGTVTGVAAGTATITVTTTDAAKTATCAVTVTTP
jgi:uncharacterized protein YjdB